MREQTVWKRLRENLYETSGTRPNYTAAMKDTAGYIQFSIEDDRTVDRFEVRCKNEPGVTFGSYKSIKRAMGRALNLRHNH